MWLSCMMCKNVGQGGANSAAACPRAGRELATVTRVAVSKTHSAAAVLEATQAGLQHFGENRVEEAVSKIPQVAEQADQPPVWHMIGHIQSRKAKEVPPLFSVVHSVDTVKLAERLSREATDSGKMLDVLLEINISGEVSKAGFAAFGWQNDRDLQVQLWDAVAHIALMPGLNLRGLMTMAPIVEEMEQTRPVFANLAGLCAALTETLGLPLPDLSMGMTDDYPVAIEEGATLVRIGRAIFGERERL